MSELIGTTAAVPTMAAAEVSPSRKGIGLAAWLPGFRRYDARTDVHAVAVRAERLAAHAEPSL